MVYWVSSSYLFLIFDRNCDYFTTNNFENPVTFSPCHLKDFDVGMVFLVYKIFHVNTFLYSYRRLNSSIIFLLFEFTLSSFIFPILVLLTLRFYVSSVS